MNDIKPESGNATLKPEENDMAKRKKTRPKPTFKQILRRILFNVLVQTITRLILRYAIGRFIANRHYDRADHFRDDGKRVELSEAKQLRILPLIDWYATEADLETEPGLAYLVEADDTTILFDLGFNQKQKAEPPLLQNARRLGVDLTKVDFIFNSHPHADHLSGLKNVLGKRIRLCKENDPLSGKPVFSPVQLRPKTSCTRVKEPCSLAPGVGTTGPLPRQLLLGYTLEQALVVKLQGKGLVLIIGCGHPGLEALVQRAEEVFQTPVYGVVGGLHYPVTQDHMRIGPIRMQQLVASPKLPWQPINAADVTRAIGFLKGREIKFLAVSAHDSCDWSLQSFAKAFPDGYVALKVGKEMSVSGQRDKTADELMVEGSLTTS
jgi:7,8-dihydropterin-6-yl-methyl-4-(beta-D-ribofuranosyl)aminobenzene 5'-phosphate synthase